MQRSVKILTILIKSTNEIEKLELSYGACDKRNSDVVKSKFEMPVGEREHPQQHAEEAF